MNEALEKYENNPEESVVLASTGMLSRRQLRKHAKMMVERNVLPPQRESVVSEDGLYLPLFYTEDAKHIAKVSNRNSLNLFMTSLLSGVMGSSMVLTSVLMPLQGYDIAEFLPTVIMSPLVLLPLLIRSAPPKTFGKLANKMGSTTVAPFADWAEKRYGIELDRDKLVVGSWLTVGIEPNDSQLVVDEKTGDHYTVEVRKDGQIYLRRSYENKVAPEANTAIQKQAITQHKKIVEEVLPSLPDEASALYNHLMSSVALLMKQELSVEESHAVKRTERTANTLVKQYHHAVSLSPSEELHRDLMKFFQAEIVFLDELKQDHANMIVKRMAVEMTAVAAAEKNNLRLEVK
jgi:hypothetical protein